MAIWRRDQGKVQSLEDMKAMMRYNNWRAEPVRWGPELCHVLVVLSFALTHIVMNPIAFAMLLTAAAVVRSPSLLHLRAV